MNPDILNFSLKVLCLFMIGATAELCLRRRFYAMTVFLTGVWITIFRLAILRSVAIYIGAFGHEPARVVDAVRGIFQGSFLSNITDTIVFVGTILLFRFISKEHRKEW